MNFDLFLELYKRHRRAPDSREEILEAFRAKAINFILNSD